MLTPLEISANPLNSFFFILVYVFLIMYTYSNYYWPWPSANKNSFGSPTFWAGDATWLCDQLRLVRVKIDEGLGWGLIPLEQWPTPLQNAKIGGEFKQLNTVIFDIFDFP